MTLPVCSKFPDISLTRKCLPIFQSEWEPCFYYSVQLLESERNYKWPEVHWQHLYHLIDVIRRKIDHLEKKPHCLVTYLSFPVIHKVGNVGIFVLLKFENKLDAVISDFIFNSMHPDKLKFALKFIQPVIIPYLSPSKVVQK